VAWYADTELDAENGLLQGKTFWFCEQVYERRGERDVYGWRLIRFQQGKPFHQVFARYEGYASDISAISPTPLVTEATDGAIWVSEAQASGLHASFWRVAPKTSRVQRYELGAPRIPVSALRPFAEHTPGANWNAALTDVLARRMPGWISPSAPMPEAARQAAETTLTMDVRPEATWSLNGTGVLMRSRTGRRDVFPVSKIKVGVLASVTSIAAIGQTLYSVVDGHLRTLDTVTGHLGQLPIPDLVKDDILRLEATPDGRLIVYVSGTSSRVLRYTPRTGKWAVIWQRPPDSPTGLTTQLEPGAVLGLDERDGVWTESSNPGSTPAQVQYWPSSGPPIAMTLAPPTEAIDAQRQRREDAEAIGFCAGRLWCGTDKGLRGWNPGTGEWTPPVAFGSGLSPESFTADINGDVYVTADDTSATVEHWDNNLRRWHTDTPPLPRDRHYGSPSPLRLAAKANDQVWITADSTLWHFSRMDDRWWRTLIPSNINWPTDMPSCRIGGSIFIGTVEGLWRVSAEGGSAQPVPIPVSGLAILQIAAASTGVWAICAVPQISQSEMLSSHTVAARLDAHTRKWRFTTITSAYPEWDTYAAPPQLWDTGGEAWLNTENGAWHWDRSDGHWHPVSQHLGLAPGPGVRHGMGVFIRSVVWDGRYDWLLTAGVYEPNDHHAVPSPPIPAIVRYDTQTGRYKGYDRGLKLFQSPVPIPLSRPDQLGQGLLASPDALWVHAGKLLSRVDKATGVWKQISQDNWPRLPVGAMTWANGAVWITDADSVLQYQAK
jgi:hypothetical protein